MVARRCVHWISVDTTLRQLNAYTRRAFCLRRVMAGDTILWGRGKAGSGVTAVWQQCWVTLCYQGWRRWRQSDKLQPSQGEERLEKYRLMNFSTKHLYVSWSSNYHEETGLSVSRAASKGFHRGPFSPCCIFCSNFYVLETRFPDTFHEWSNVFERILCIIDSYRLVLIFFSNHSVTHS